MVHDHLVANYFHHLSPLRTAMIVTIFEYSPVLSFLQIACPFISAKIVCGYE